MQFSKNDNKFVNASDNIAHTDPDFVGTAEYASPEMLTHSVTDHRSTDIWALGCILYYFFHGKTPFKGESDKITFDNILNSRYAIRNDVPQDAQDCIRQLLTKDPEERLVHQGNFDKLKSHPFFKGVDFSLLYKSVVPFRIDSKENSANSKSESRSSNSYKTFSASTTCSPDLKCIHDTNEFNLHINLATLSQNNSPLPTLMKEISNSALSPLLIDKRDFKVKSFIYFNDTPVVIHNYVFDVLLNPKSKQIVHEGNMTMISFLKDRNVKLKIFNDKRFEIWEKGSLIVRDKLLIKGGLFS